MLNAEPFARFDYSYVGRLGQLARRHRVRRLGQSRAVAGRLPDRRPARSVSKATSGAARCLRRQPVGRAREPVPEQSLEGAAPVRQPAAHHRRPGPVQLLMRLTILVATSVVRGSRQGESHGGVYLVDFEQRPRGADAGLEHDGHRLAGPRLGPRPARHRVRWRDGVHRRERRAVRVHAGLPAHRLLAQPLPEALPRDLPVTSARCSSPRRASTRFSASISTAGCSAGGLHVAADGGGFRRQAIRSRSSATGPAPSNALHLNNVHCERGGMHVSGLRTGGILLFNGRELEQVGESAGQARTTRGRSADGVLFNDTQSDVVRFASRDERAGVQRAALSPRNISTLVQRRRIRGSRARRSRAACASSTRTRSPAAPRRRRSRFIR